MYAKEQIATLPLDNRTLVTGEGAFKYFSKAYDLQAAYIREINTDNQGTPEQLSRIIQIINDEKVPRYLLKQV
ncbi:zinc ABC transporter substrate-binding protein [Erysipelothrix sp. D19-032]